MKFAYALLFSASAAFAQSSVTPEELKKLNPVDFKEWLVPKEIPAPENNAITPERVELGKMLFFDKRLSGDKQSSCATCHIPAKGWSENLIVSSGFKGKPMSKNSQTIVNSAWNKAQFWDGRKKTLEDQIIGPMTNPNIMATDIENFFKWVSSNPTYKAKFEKAYPGEPIDIKTLAKAIATFERTVITDNSAFDRWVQGDKGAMTEQQLRGMVVFMDAKKANCAVCHRAPHFTDYGYHNLGLASSATDADTGHFKVRALPMLKGAFKTPMLREVEHTGPYFHDGSAKDLRQVMDHYAQHGVVKTNLSPNFLPITITEQDKDDLVAFMKALSGPVVAYPEPVLPQD